MRHASFLLIAFTLTLALAFRAHACIWDAETLSQEESRSHDLATAILGQLPAPEDPQVLQSRIQNYETNREENNPDWWNNLAGAYLRLNQPATAAKLLEPVISKFPNNYGIHANLGTAYHLMGRYADAEKEIARDLEINPDAHFGLEKYHLALLQYLSRSTNYQARHVYVDEFTGAFFESNDGLLRTWFHLDAIYSGTNLPALEAEYAMATATNADRHVKFLLMEEMAAIDTPQPYSIKWDLADNTNLENGVIYMAEMNPREPACYEMLGVVAWKKRDIHLAISAFEKAINLGSFKTPLLEHKVSGLKDYLNQVAFNKRLDGFIVVLLVLGGIAFFVILLLVIVKFFRAIQRKFNQQTH